MEMPTTPQYPPYHWWVGDIPASVNGGTNNERM